MRDFILILVAIGLCGALVLWQGLVGVAVVGVVTVLGRVVYRGVSGRAWDLMDMTGKTVIVTGATAGIGLEATRALAKCGARVILACRNLQKAVKVANEIRGSLEGKGELVVRQLDTSDLASVRNFAQEIIDTEKSVHVLVNNAGMFSSSEKVMTKDGLEVTMATNHFGHFLLTNLLVDLLKKSGPSRIVNVASSGHEFVEEMDPSKLNLEAGYDSMKAYGLSKLTNILHAAELARRLEGTGVTANSLHPGAVSTDIVKDNQTLFWRIILSFFTHVTGKDAALGAQTTVHLAASRAVEGITGRYFVDCKEYYSPSRFVHDASLARKVWETSEQCVQLQPQENPF